MSVPTLSGDANGIPSPQSHSSAKVPLGKALASVSLLGLAVALLAWADRWWALGLCGFEGCQDPRWLALGELFGLPLPFYASALYIGLLLLTRRITSGESTARYWDRPCLLAISMALGGGHIYLIYLQAEVLHAWCMICVAAAIVAAAAVVLAVLCTGFSGLTRRQNLGGIVAGALSLALLVWSLNSRTGPVAPDPLVRPGSPAIYRPEPATSAPEDLARKIREAKSQGRVDAEIEIEIFTDFQCPKCAHFETYIRPRLQKHAAAEHLALRWTTRVFLLEGHPLGWQAGLLALSAGVDGRFWEVQEALFRTQAEWVRAGDPLGSILALEARDSAAWERALQSADRISAAKSVMREDVARGARLSVQTVPAMVFTRKADGRQSIVAGAQALSAYQQALEGLRAPPGERTSSTNPVMFQN